MKQGCEGNFTGLGGMELFYQSWYGGNSKADTPADRPRGVVGIVHGLGSHSGLFAHVVEGLLPLGYAIYSFDLRGHGRSAGQRGHINTWAEFRGDLAAFLRLIREKEPNCPCFLLGHSLGGTIVLDYVLRFPDQVQGVIAMAPALGSIAVSPLKLTLGRLFSWIYPQFRLKTGIALAVGSRDPEVLTAYEQDPLRHDLATARLETEFLLTVDWIWSHARELEVPLLILHGGADRLTMPEGSRVFFRQVTYSDKELKEYPDAYHELHNDLNYPEVIADIKAWLESHLVRNSCDES